MTPDVLTVSERETMERVKQHDEYQRTGEGQSPYQILRSDSVWCGQWDTNRMCADAYKLAAALVRLAPALEWQPIATAPQGRWIVIYAPGAEFDLSDIVCPVKWHENGGFCVDELRYPTHWREVSVTPVAALPKGEADHAK